MVLRLPDRVGIHLLILCWTLLLWLGLQRLLKLHGRLGVGVGSLCLLVHILNDLSLTTLLVISLLGTELIVVVQHKVMVCFRSSLVLHDLGLGLSIDLVLVGLCYIHLILLLLLNNEAFVLVWKSLGVGGRILFHWLRDLLTLSSLRFSFLSLYHFWGIILGLFDCLSLLLPCLIFPLLLGVCGLWENYLSLLNSILFDGVFNLRLSPVLLDFGIDGLDLGLSGQDELVDVLESELALL
mmetsp:Transcript_9285/g.15626  ORF Transcript_9285/g.15626 Transcript_9285/m.15626 type:complete len:239 (-) Transcript_9285:1584-2300(-)|eukprot:CAMPEP_0168609480 /NCGR_PEP_ID=MMETSP0449_2-20121227/1231_1 /TAXON_ID=1082188 /ORGANISM="Strombidium rassoulzadegani, Strain ras09" /LENGTH=238 /DNA_ID=CAMNT_0008649631 /DNA_START=71 /DNA_END=787 /DNA_ORIENTATION=-